MLVCYGKHTKQNIWVGQFVHLSVAEDAIFVQADGDELDKIIREIPYISANRRVQRFYGEDAKKVMYTFIDWNGVD